MIARRISWGLVILGGLLAAGMMVAAFILGGQFKNLGAGRQSIVVKGLAEKPVRADLAEWSLGVVVYGDTFGATLEKVRSTRPVIDAFLKQQGFGEGDTIEEGQIEVRPNMEDERSPNGEWRSVQKGFSGSQNVRLRSRDLGKVAAAQRAVIQLPAEGKPVVYSNPSYLVSDLETVKMSLIGDATRNARQRAEEFAKVGGVSVGVMRSASQGAFYILPADSSSEASDYGGVYDKTTVEKKARVVVTIDYVIE